MLVSMRQVPSRRQKICVEYAQQSTADSRPKPAGNAVVNEPAPGLPALRPGDMIFVSLVDL